MRIRDYVFTIFSKETPENLIIINDELKEKCINNPKIIYAIVGTEICPSTNEKHLQGYISLKNPKSLSAFQKFTNSFKIKHYASFRKGTPTQARNYCWKGNNKKKGTELPQKDATWWQTGSLPIGQGTRTDLMNARETLEAGGNMREIIQDTRSTQSIQFAQKYLTYNEKKRRWKTNVYWFYGKTGKGKSETAFKIFNDDSKVYEANETSQWWDGYDGHENVIIDDMRHDFCKFNILLRLLDRYPLRIQVKGAYRQFLARNIIITSPYHPKDLYGHRCQEDIQQLLRRITESDLGLKPIKFPIKIETKRGKVTQRELMLIELKTKVHKGKQHKGG